MKFENKLIVIAGNIIAISIIILMIICGCIHDKPIIQGQGIHFNSQEFSDTAIIH
jgi:hypothetical protein